jgi:hypothetical protein
MGFGMNPKRLFLIVAILGMAGCVAYDWNHMFIDRMNIVSATYGPNCGAPRGNATSDVARACNGTSKCDYRIDVNILGDPRPGCVKTFEAEYQCPSGATQTVSAPGEAGLGTVVTMQCANQTGSGRVDILTATYGPNCGARRGNATQHIARACNGTSKCDYRIDVNNLGDPRPGCVKTYEAEYRCSASGSTQAVSVPGEAGLGTIVTLQC